MEGKKISFGFMKNKKVEKPLKPLIEEEKREYIECVEEKSIKVVGGEEVHNDAPLVIPMKPNTLITAERLKEIAEKVESSVNEPEIKEEPTALEEQLPENETLDQMAVRELMQQAKKEVKNEDVTMTITTQAKPVIDGQKESTLDDYESVPVQQFGMAMLRGMGWTPNKDGSKYKQPELRPKGLGLGADKVIKENQKKQSTKGNKEEELVIVKNSFVKMTTGKYSGYYGKVVSLDEDNGRVMVDIAVKKETVSLSEFMMMAVSKSEYDRESKVINQDSYQEYKKNEKVSSKPSKLEDKSSSRRNDVNIKNDRDRSNDNYRRDSDDKPPSNDKNRDKPRQRKDSSSSEDRSRARKKDKNTIKRYSSSESINSLSNNKNKREISNVKYNRDRDEKSSSNDKNRDKPRHKRNSSSSEDRSRRREKDRKRYSSSDSLNSHPNAKNERQTSNDKYRRDRDEKLLSNDKNREKLRQRKDSSSSEDRSRRKKKDKKKYGSSDSLDSLSDDDRKRRKHKSKSRKRCSSSESETRKRKDKEEGKRDIDKKRKGKKKKRDRDRSPNYKKHRK